MWQGFVRILSEFSDSSIRNALIFTGNVLAASLRMDSRGYQDEVCYACTTRGAEDNYRPVSDVPAMPSRGPKGLLNRPFTMSYRRA